MGKGEGPRAEILLTKMNPDARETQILTDMKTTERPNFLHTLLLLLENRDGSPLSKEVLRQVIDQMEAAYKIPTTA